MAIVRAAGRPKRLDYLPLVTASLAMLLLLAVLPSALNLPQTDPTETLEYAPVPPEDNEITPPPSGNLSSLGLGSSRSIGSSADFDQGAGAPVGPDGKAVKAPSTKRCVGTPPRQTEDPLSPPCVASYNGDNGGATYKGVNEDEIRIIYFFSGGGGCRSTSRGRECTPSNRFVDLGKPPAENEDVIARGIRRLQTYFNDRYQTYGRFAHFWVWYHSGFTPENQRARAAEHIKLIDPFAVVHGVTAHDYTQVMARRGVLTFTSDQGTPAEFFRKFPRLIWSYLPALEIQARSFARMVCRQVVNRPAAFSGNPGENGKPRRLGLLVPDAEDYGENHAQFARLVKNQIEACGGKFVAEGTHPSGNVEIGQDHEHQQQMEQNIAAFRAEGVTTVIWAWGFDLGGETNTAAKQGYFPEWILAGDTIMEGYDLGQLQNQEAFDGKAWIQTVIARVPAFNQDLCFTAMREADPQTPQEDAALICRLYLAYEAIRQLFIGIQVAGPKLNPATIDKGYHAIPPGPSGSPFVPACYYEPGDYTCIKDGTAMYWDREGTAPGSDAPGCWRMPEEGKRYTAETWPERELSATANRQRDPCNGYSSGSFNISLNTGF